MFRIRRRLKENKALFIAGYFLIIQILIIFRNVYASDYFAFFYICDFAPMLIAYGFWRKNYQLIKGAISLGLLGQMMFFVNLILAQTTGITFLDISYLFNYSLFFRFATLLVHLTLLIALILNYEVRPERKSLWYSMGFIVAVYILSLLFTPQSSNINFVHSFLLIVGPSVYYTAAWPFVTFLALVLPTYYLQLKLYELHDRKRS